MTYDERIRNYEIEKQRLQNKNLCYKEYEIELRKLIENGKFEISQENF